jgi:predicted PurR-regulated permease PerM
MNTENKNIDLSQWENWDKLNEDTAKFILEQSEKNLSEMIQAADVLTSRANTILQFSVTSIAVLTGFIYSDFSKGDLLTHLAIIGLLFLVVISILAIIVNSLYKVVPVGNSPKNMISDEKVLHEKQTIVFLYNSIKNIQKSLDKNDTRNRSRADKILTIQRLIWIGLSFELIFYPVLYYLVYRL